MSKKTEMKGPLGRGLSNLLDISSEKIPTVDASPNYKEIPINDIEPNKDQPRKVFKEKELQELAETLHSVGLIEPVVVRILKPGKFQLIAGERRWRAAKIAGFKYIPAVLRQANDLQAIELGIIENIQRENLNPIEEGRAYQQWMQLTKQKPDMLAKKIGKNRSTIRNLTRILNLPEEVLTLIENNKLSIGQARPLLSIGNTSQLIKLAKKISDEGWTSRKVENEIAQLTEKKKVSITGEKKDPNLHSLEQKLRNHFSAKVQLQHKKEWKWKDYCLLWQSK